MTDEEKLALFESALREIARARRRLVNDGDGHFDECGDTVEDLVQIAKEALEKACA